MDFSQTLRYSPLPNGKKGGWQSICRSGAEGNFPSPITGGVKVRSGLGRAAAGAEAPVGAEGAGLTVVGTGLGEEEETGEARVGGSAMTANVFCKKDVFFG